MDLSQLHLEQSIASLFKDNPLQGVYIIENERFTYVNSKFAEIFGYRIDELVNQQIFDILYPNDKYIVHQNIENKLSGKTNHLHYETHGLTKSGNPIFLEIFRHIIESNGNKLIIGHLLDITERKDNEKNLLDLENAINMSSILVKTDKNGKILDVNDRFCEISKYPKGELVGKTPRVVSSGHHANDFFRKMWQKIQCGKVWRDEVKNKAKDGSVYWVDTTIVPYLDNERNPYHYLSISDDITDKKNYEDEIKHMAYYDHLTDLPNRRNFVEKLEQDLIIANVNQKILTVMFLDLDKFKNVNDTLGRLVGDQLLVQVGIRLKANLGKQCFIARLGGVEFGISIPNIFNLEASIEYANQIIKSFEEPFIIDNYECKITTSIGIATFPEAGEDSITILKHANLAMCRAKNRGRNNYQFYSPTMNISTYKKFTLQNDLQKALQQDQFF